MATRTIAQFTATVQQNCAWAATLAFTNSDASPFNLTNITLTGQFRSTAQPSATPLATATFTVTDATGGIAVVAISAHDAGLLPATGTKFNQLTHVMLEIDGATAADPNNPFRLAEGDIGVSPGGNSSPSAATAPTVPLETISLVVGAVSAAAARALLGLNDGANLPPATTTTPGAMSEDDFNKLAALAPGGWVDTFALLTRSVVPTLTAVRSKGYADINSTPPNCTAVAAPLTDGGAILPNTGVQVSLSNVILGSASLSPWAFCMDVVVPVVDGATVGTRLGVRVSGDDAASFATYHGFDAAKLCVELSGAAHLATSWTVDGGRHFLTLIYDTTTLRAYLDFNQTPILTSAQALPNLAGFLSAYDATGGLRVHGWAVALKG